MQQKFIVAKINYLYIFIVLVGIIIGNYSELNNHNLLVVSATIGMLLNNVETKDFILRIFIVMNLLIIGNAIVLGYNNDYNWFMAIIYISIISIISYPILKYTEKFVGTKTIQFSFGMSIVLLWLMIMVIDTNRVNIDDINYVALVIITFFVIMQFVYSFKYLIVDKVNSDLLSKTKLINTLSTLVIIVSIVSYNL